MSTLRSLAALAAQLAPLQRRAAQLSRELAEPLEAVHRQLDELLRDGDEEIVRLQQILAAADASPHVAHRTIGRQPDLLAASQTSESAESLPGVLPFPQVAHPVGAQDAATIHNLAAHGIPPKRIAALAQLPLAAVVNVLAKRPSKGRSRAA
ncbi:MAG: hypothetical protein ACKV0T_02635 [Planctomycetales bacterium]